MQETEINRRRFLAGAIAATLATPGLVRARPARDEPLYAATRKNAAGQYSAAIFDAAGQDRNAVSLPARGHDVCVCPITKRCVAFARRPGNFAVAFSRDRAAPPVRFTTPPDRHFYGHGVFSPDGRLLFATENDFDAGEGRIGVYDATGAFKRIGEFATYGVGPHDLALLADGTTLVIANGGVATHPDIGDGRIPLNLASMTPSLAYVDLRSTDLIENHSLPRLHHQASLRHLDAGRGSRLVIGCQSRAADGSEQPLVLIHQRGEALTPVRLEARTAAAMRNYVSSVAIDASGEIAAVTSAKGGLAVFLDVASGRVLGSRSLADVSGVAVGAAKQTFLLTSGEGDILAGATPETTASQTKTLWNWDNHAVKL